MRLRGKFFKRHTVTVARELLGKTLVVRARYGKLLRAVITETEAYHGANDRASHASRGLTPRTSIMFGPPGSWYVYLVYGMYHCCNVVTGPKGFPAAVLIRAVALPGGNGPGKLCKLLGIDRRLNGLPTVNDRIWIEDADLHIPRSRIIAGPRVGVDYAGSWAEKPWRFTLLAR